MGIPKGMENQETIACRDCTIRQIALFHPLSEGELERVSIVRNGQRLLQGNEVLCAEGKRSTEAYTLYEGWVMRLKSLEDGRRQILSFALPGDLLCFHPNLDTPLRHGVQALTAARVCAFPKRQLLEVFRLFPELALRMSWIASRDEVRNHEHLMSLGRRPARERLAHLFLELYHRLLAREPGLEGRSVTLPLRQEHIADAIGLTTIHVSRTLKSLREDGLLEYHTGRLTLFDRPALVELTGYREDLQEPRSLL